MKYFFYTLFFISIINYKIVAQINPLLDPIRQNQTTQMVDWESAQNMQAQVKQTWENQQNMEPSIDWESVGPVNLGGTTLCLLIDRNNPDRIYAGHQSSGLWISDNGGKSWKQHAQTKNILDIQAVTRLKQGANGTIFLTAKLLGVSSGIYKSIDGGVTFQSLPNTQITSSESIWQHINDFAIDLDDANRIYVAHQSRLSVSEDGGETWELMDGLETEEPILQIKITKNNKIHVLTKNMYWETNENGNFRPNAFSLPIQHQFAQLAIAPSNPAYRYLLINNIYRPNCFEQIIQTVDNGKSWHVIADKAYLAFEIETSSNNGYLCTDFLQLAIHPQDPEYLLFGTTNLWSWKPTTNWIKLDKNNFNPYSLDYLPNNKKAFLFHPTDKHKVLVATTQGIFQSANIHTAQPNFVSLNNKYISSEFNSVAASLDGQSILGSGLEYATSYIEQVCADYPSWGEPIYLGDDGVASVISHINPNVLYFGVAYGGLMVSGSKGRDVWSALGAELDCEPLRIDGNCNPDNKIDGIETYKHPFIFWENPKAVTGQSLEEGELENYIVTIDATHKIYRATNVLDFTKPTDWEFIVQLENILELEKVTAFDISKYGQSLWIGTAQGRLFRVQDLDIDDITDFRSGEIRIPELKDRYITSITINDVEPSNIIVTAGNYGNDTYIFWSNTGTRIPAAVSFHALHGNENNQLPSMPIFDLVIDKDQSNRLFVATDVGIWEGNIETFDVFNVPEQITWTLQNHNMGFVPVTEIKQQRMNRDGCHVLYAATAGRGLFRSNSYTYSTCFSDLQTCEIVPSITDKPLIINDLTLYPQPVKVGEPLYINNLQLPAATPIHLMLYNLQGQLIQKQKIQMNATTPYSTTIPTQQLTSGMYLLHLAAVNKSFSLQEKVVVVE